MVRAKVSDTSRGRLSSWQRLLQRGDAFLPELSAAMADRALGFVDEGFEQERDPYGKRWAPKQRPDGRKVLQGATGQLRSGWRRKEIDKRFFSISTEVPYAAAHQVEWQGHRPARPMVPTTARGLPKSWSDAFEDLSVDLLAQYLSGGTARRKTRRMAGGSDIDDLVRRVQRRRS